MTKVQGPKAPVIAVLNMKGGVGKTTVSAHLMRHLFERLHSSTLLIDLDPQHNLSQTVLSSARYEALKDAGKTVARVMEPAPAKSLFTVTQNPGPPACRNRGIDDSNAFPAQREISGTCPWSF